MHHEKTFSPKASLGAAWNLFKRHGWFLSGSFLITLLASFLLGGLADDRTLFGNIITNLLSIVVSILVSISWTTVALRYANTQKVTARDFFSRYNVFWKYLGASILYGLIVLGGIILLVVPGIIWAIKYKMFSYLIVEKGMGIRESLRESARITYGAKWKLFWFAILTGLINVLGLLVLGVGFLITAPIVMIANAHVYKSLKDRTPTDPTKTVQPEPEITAPEATEKELVTE